MNITIIEYIIIAAIIAMLAAVGSVGYLVLEHRTSPTIELRKDEFVCTKYEDRTFQQPIWSGKVLVLVPTTHAVCVEYKATK